MKTELRAKRSRYTFDIPLQLRNEFAAVCDIQGKDRVDVMLEFIRGYVEADRAMLDRLGERHKKKGLAY